MQYVRSHTHLSQTQLCLCSASQSQVLWMTLWMGLNADASSNTFSCTRMSMSCLHTGFWTFFSTEICMMKCYIFKRSLFRLATSSPKECEAAFYTFCTTNIVADSSSLTRNISLLPSSCRWEMEDDSGHCDRRCYFLGFFNRNLPHQWEAAWLNTQSVQDMLSKEV